MKFSIDDELRYDSPETLSKILDEVSVVSSKYNTHRCRWDYEAIHPDIKDDEYYVFTNKINWHLVGSDDSLTVKVEDYVAVMNRVNLGAGTNPFKLKIQKNINRLPHEPALIVETKHIIWKSLDEKAKWANELNYEKRRKNRII